MKILGKIAFLLIFLIISPAKIYPAIINIDTEYKLTDISYSNIKNFDSFYNQSLTLLLQGKFEPKIEISVKLRSLGILGSTASISQASWQAEYPYKSINFDPFIENVFIKAENFSELPVDLIIGKQPLEYADGTVISDNNTGFSTFKAIIKYPSLVTTEIFTSKIVERFQRSTDFDVYGLVSSAAFFNHGIQLYIQSETDNSGTTLFKESGNDTITKTINTNYFGMQINRFISNFSYSAIYFIGEGNYTKPDDSSSEIHNKSWTVTGTALINEHTRWVGKLNTKLTISGSTPNELVQPVNLTAFSPALRKRYTGLEKYGWGEILGMNGNDSFFDDIQKYYSGYGIIGIDFLISPAANWDICLSNIFFNAANAYSVSGNTFPEFGLPYFGQKHSLGMETGIIAKYAHSNYLEFKFKYAQYNPPDFKDIWLDNGPMQKISVEITGRF